MPHPGSGSATAITAIFAVLLLVLIGTFVAWRGGVFGNADRMGDTEVHTPGLTR